LDSGIDPTKVRGFYDQLAEVQRVTESLFDTLSVALTVLRKGSKACPKSFFVLTSK
jgi:hypothetical protein